MPAPLAMEPIIQKDIGDCVIVCLSMILGIPYVTVYRAAHALYPACGSKGLTTRQMLRVVRSLGFHLTPTAIENANLEDETGILDVKIKQSLHAVVLFEGVVFNPADGLIYNLEAYLAGKAKPVRLFRPQ